MTRKPTAGMYLLLGSMTLAVHAPRSLAGGDAHTAPAVPIPADRNRDGQHDFDFELGTWEIHLQRRAQQLAGSNQWVRFDGTSVTQKVWNGRSQIEQFETDGAGGRIEGLTLRTYNPQTHQWNLYWANSKDGLVVPVQVGQFRNGRGEFYGYDTLNGRPILIRFLWTHTQTDTPHFEQSFSEDGGQTWEVNWITDQHRVSAAAINPHPAPPALAVDAGNKAAGAATARDGQHDFDPLIGHWTYHLKRRLHPLTGSSSWVDLKGTGECIRLWDGRADLDEVDLDGPSGRIEGLTLRLYDPQARQWRLYWANSKDGNLVAPQVGGFRDGRGEFYAPDTLDGRTILVRFGWSNMTTPTPHFEQAFSSDGGKSWEVNWITDQTRLPGAE
ncbi:MAG TPA: hypothetical protein VFO44_14100 [Steroidobacteraceae bacterium]|nr:hypothetical protein [Steroidobacteraceae bacterium]